MTYREWEWELKCLLRKMPQKEGKEIIEYYKEIYGDKREAGFSDAEILMEFGTPEECAEKIKSENENEPLEEKNREPRRMISLPSTAIGLLLITVLILIPLAALMLGVIVTFAAMCIGGAAVSIGGIAVIIWSIVQLISGIGFASSMALFGMGIAMIGIGTITAVVFLVLTKYTAQITYKCFMLIYTNRREK